MEAPPACSSPCWRSRSPSSHFHSFPSTLPSRLREFSFPSLRPGNVASSLFADCFKSFAVSARLDVRNSLENDRSTPSSSHPRGHSGGLWAADFAISSHLVDGGASTLQQDWRAVRARLCGAQFDQSGTEALREACAHWAHESPIPEEGCVLLATENLDSHPVLRKSVVLLLSSDNGSIRGVIVNRTLPFPAEEVSNVDMGVALGLGSCPTFLGGPLHTASSFHLLSPRRLQGFEPVLPGVHSGSGQTALFSAWNSIRRKRIAPEEVRVHIGHMEWDVRSLSAELVVFQWWKIVSCSSSLLHLQDVDCMWENVQRLVSECN